MRMRTLVSVISAGTSASLTMGAALWAADATEARWPVADVLKMSVERPAEGVIKNTSRAVGQPAVAAARPAFSNPRVKPGEVCWHASFAEACQASARTHKPVLLFQLLGKLDRQFC